MVSPSREETDDLPDKDVAKDFYAKYEPKELLGRGVSSTVRRCVEKETGKDFAAKIIDISGDIDDFQGLSIRETTLREIQILKLVAGHPYIIELHDVFESTTFIFLVFELCKNGELFDYLTNVVALSEKKTKGIMKHLLEAIEYIHSKNVVHRDLKEKELARWRQWMRMVNRKNWTPSHHAKLCQDNFECSCFVLDPTVLDSVGFKPGRLRLKKPSAIDRIVPTIFCHHKKNKLKAREHSFG